MQVDPLNALAQTHTLLQRNGVSLGEVPGRLAGLSGDEQSAGVPAWAWVGLGVVLGGAVVAYNYPTIMRAVGARQE